MAVRDLIESKPNLKNMEDVVGFTSRELQNLNYVYSHPGQPVSARHLCSEC